MALGVVAAGLLAFSAGGALASISNFLFGSPFDPFIELAEHSDGFVKTADALQSISVSINRIKSSMRGLDVESLTDITNNIPDNITTTQTGGAVPIQNRIAIYLDGRKIGESIEETLGTVT